MSVNNRFNPDKITHKNFSRNIHARFPFCVLEFVSIRKNLYFFTIYTLINAFLTQNKGLYFVRINLYEVTDYNTIPIIVFAPSKSHESADGGADTQDWQRKEGYSGFMKARTEVRPWEAWPPMAL